MLVGLQALVEGGLLGNNFTQDNVLIPNFGGTTYLHLQGKSIMIIQAPSQGKGRIFLQNAGSSCLCAYENYV